MLHRRSKAGDFDAVVCRTEEPAETSAKLAATPPRSIRAEVAIVAGLNAPGLVCYACRILAMSLARDVLHGPPGCPRA